MIAQSLKTIELSDCTVVTSRAQCIRVVKLNGASISLTGSELASEPKYFP